MKSGPYVDIRGYHKGVTGSTIRNTVHFADGTIYRYLVDYGIVSILKKLILYY